MLRTPVSSDDVHNGVHVFAARIQKIWIMRCINVPRDVSRAFEAAVGRDAKHIPVRGTIEGLPVESTLVPRGGSCYRLHVHSSIWRKLRIDAGAIVEVTLAIDAEPRDPRLPPDLAAGLALEPRALAAFNAETPAMRRQLVRFMDSAKHERTRQKRVRQVAKIVLDRAKRRERTKKLRSAKTKSA
jgi:hypothetical protein